MTKDLAFKVPPDFPTKSKKAFKSVIVKVGSIKARRRGKTIFFYRKVISYAAHLVLEISCSLFCGGRLAASHYGVAIAIPMGLDLPVDRRPIKTHTWLVIGHLYTPEHIHTKISIGFFWFTSFLEPFLVRFLLREISVFGDFRVFSCIFSINFLPQYSKFFQNIPSFSKIFQVFPKYSKFFQNIPNFS